MCRTRDEKTSSFNGLAIIEEGELRHDVIRSYEDHNYEHYYSRFVYGDYCSRYHPPTSSHRKIEASMGGVKLTFIVVVKSPSYCCDTQQKNFVAKVSMDAEILDQYHQRVIDVCFHKGVRDSSGNLVSRHQWTPSRHKGAFFREFSTAITNETELGCFVRVMKPRSAPLNYFTNVAVPHNVVFDVQGVKFYADKSHLMEVSSYFAAMFNEKFRFEEALQRVIKLNETEVLDFNDFLHAIAVRDAVPPDPTNVAALAELASYYDVEKLKSACAKHLHLCPELPMSVRLEIALRCLPDDALLDLLRDVPTDEKNDFIRSQRR